MKISEMTQRAGDIESGMLRYVENAKSRFDSFKRIGDIEEHCQVFKLDNEYLLYDSDRFIGYFFIDKNGERFRLRLAFVDRDYRGKNYFEYFIWFLVRHESMEEIEISDVHSIATEEALKKLSYRMDLHWEKDGKKEKYEPGSVNKYYGARPTGWVVVICNEGATKAFEDWPRYFDLKIGHIGIFYYC